MPFTMPFIPASCAGARGVGGVHIHHLQAASLGLVLHKLLELRPSPAVQTGTHSLTRLDALAKVSQFFKGNNGAAGPKSFRDNRPADFVVHVSDVASFPARDFPQKLFGTLGAVALKTLAKVQVFVAFKTEFSAAKEFAGAGGGEVVFAQIHAQNLVSFKDGRVGQVQHQIEEPALGLAHKFRLFGYALSQVVLLKDSRFAGKVNAACCREQGQCMALDGVGAFVEMHRSGRLEGKQRPGFFLFELGTVCQEGFVSACDLAQRVADHLAAQFRELFPKGVITQVMQLYTVAAALLSRNPACCRAGLGKAFLQAGQQGILFWGKAYAEGDGSLHGDFVSQTLKTHNKYATRRGASSPA